MQPRMLDRYAVFFFPQALEALGEGAKPFLQGEGTNAHVICREIDTAGALLEMTLECETPEGEPIEVELMLPASMVRMIVSARGDGSFGFRPRPAALPEPGEGIPGLRGPMPSEPASSKPAPSEPAPSEPARTPDKP